MQAQWNLRKLSSVHYLRYSWQRHHGVSRKWLVTWHLSQEVERNEDSHSTYFLLFSVFFSLIPKTEWCCPRSGWETKVLTNPVRLTMRMHRHSSPKQHGAGIRSLTHEPLINIPNPNCSYHIIYVCVCVYVTKFFISLVSLLSSSLHFLMSWWWTIHTA